MSLFLLQSAERISVSPARTSSRTRATWAQRYPPCQVPSQTHLIARVWRSQAPKPKIRLASAMACQPAPRPRNVRLAPQARRFGDPDRRRRAPAPEQLGNSSCGGRPAPGKPILTPSRVNRGPKVSPENRSAGHASCARVPKASGVKRLLPDCVKLLFRHSGCICLSPYRVAAGLFLKKNRR